MPLRDEKVKRESYASMQQVGFWHSRRLHPVIFLRGPSENRDTAWGEQLRRNDKTVAGLYHLSVALAKTIPLQRVPDLPLTSVHLHRVSRLKLYRPAELTGQMSHSSVRNL